MDGEVRPSLEEALAQEECQGILRDDQDPSHFGAQRQETGLQKAERVAKEEMRRLGWD